MDRILIVSADEHITMPPDAVREYLDPAFRNWLDEYFDDTAERLRKTDFFRFPPEALDVIDTENRIRTGGDIPWDLDRRLVEMDREGVAAAILIPQDHYALVPFFDPSGRAY